MNTLKAGFARVDITPPLGIHINGYYIDRYAEKILDPLEINCLALECGDTRVALIAVDNMGIHRDILHGRQLPDGCQGQRAVQMQMKIDQSIRIHQNYLLR